jgi:beta-carotene hydroxylase
MRHGIPAPDRSLTQRPPAGLDNPTLLVFLAAVTASSVSTLGAVTWRLPFAIAGTINGVCIYALYTVTHEAVHGTAHPHYAINRWLGRVAAGLQIMTFPMFRAIHLQHHAFTNDPQRDPDHVIGRKPRWLLPLWLAVRLTHDNAFMLRHRLWTGRRGVGEHVVTIGLQAGTMLCATALGYGQAVLLLWLVPVIVAGAILHLTVGWLVHSPHGSQHPLENTRLFPGLIWQCLTLSQNYHLVHHLWTNIPWFRYSAAAELATAVVAEHRASLPPHHASLGH